MKSYEPHWYDIPEQSGSGMYDLVSELYPVCRSITGEGVRQTLRRLQDLIPLKLHEVPSGSQVFDWTVPLEWNIRDAYIANLRGERIVDFRRHNLHVVGYSRPVRRRLSLEELRPHLHTIPSHPEWIPYRTSYYNETWGFCLPHRLYEQMSDEQYDVCIDATIEPGSLTYGELVLPGELSDEVLLSCHICHPSLCNDNLSGIAVATFLASILRDVRRRYSYRFLFIPGTIGSITWLSQHRDQAARIKHGLVLTGVGDPGPVTYKRSRRGNADIDRAMQHVLKHSAQSYSVVEFSPYGYDERQYCSPGFDLPVGCYMRTPHGQYPEYHTSADDLSFVRRESLRDSLEHCLRALFVVDRNAIYVRTNPFCEPQLGKRGLYRTVAGQQEGAVNEMALLWVLNLSDGKHSLLDIAERSGMSFEEVYRAAEALLQHDLLQRARLS